MVLHNNGGRDKLIQNIQVIYIKEKERVIGKRGWRGERVGGCYLFFVGLSLLSILMILYPSAVAGALQAEAVNLQLTPTSGLTAIPTPSLTPEPQAQVGANAALVCGAGILVIIIIAGLMWSSRWMQIRGHEVEQEGIE